MTHNLSSSLKQQNDIIDKLSLTKGLPEQIINYLDTDPDYLDFDLKMQIQ